jgi:excisionase family DNA binding protein
VPFSCELLGHRGPNFTSCAEDDRNLAFQSRFDFVFGDPDRGEGGRSLMDTGGRNHDGIAGDVPGGTAKERSLLISVREGVLLRVESAAILLGIGRTTMYELIRHGGIPVVRIGRRTLVHRYDLERFARAQRDR